MRQLWETPGGVHPPENKVQSLKLGIGHLTIPQKLILPLVQHIGDAAIPCVAIGDVVLKGQKIASASGDLSAPVHAPTSGVISAIEDRPVAHPSGMSALCIEVTSDGEEHWIDLHGHAEYKQLSSQEVSHLIADAGVTGLGGAGFPSAAKLDNSRTRSIDTLIINATECEPYITADDILIRERAAEIIQGIDVISHVLDMPRRVLIGIENNKKDAIDAFKKVTKNLDKIQVAALQVKYPQGGEKQLVRAILNREVPKNGLPLDVGVVVNNVGTIFAIYEAIQHNKPLIERVVTVTGKKVENASNFWVKIGTPIKDLITEVGGLPEGTRKIVNGGPMMGKAIKNTDVPVTKGTSGILVVSEDEASRGEPENCIRCGECVFVCPMGLEPHLLMNLSEKGLFERASNEDIMTCIECGSCSYVCPSNRPLLDFIRFGKNIVKKLETSKN